MLFAMPCCVVLCCALVWCVCADKLVSVHVWSVLMNMVYAHTCVSFCFY